MNERISRELNWTSSVWMDFTLWSYSQYLLN